MRRKLREPAQNVQVTNAAGRFFDVGFEMEDGVVEFRVPPASHFRQMGGEQAAVPVIEGVEPLCSGSKHGFVSLYEAKIEEADVKLNILLIQLRAFRDGSDGMAGAKAAIPERADKVCDGGAMPSHGAFIFKKKQEVDIGMREEFAAAIPAYCAEGQIAARRAEDRACRSADDFIRRTAFRQEQPEYVLYCYKAASPESSLRMRMASWTS